MSLSYLYKTCQFIVIRPFSEYCYTILDVQWQYFVPLSKGWLRDDRNVHNFFSVLNLTIIRIKPFTCNNTIFSVSFLNEILFPYLNILSKHTILGLHLKQNTDLTEHWLTDQASIHNWYSFPNASIFHNSVWRVILILCDFYFQKFWLIHYLIKNMTYISRMFDSHGFIRYSPFWFLNPLGYLPKQLSSPVLVALTGATLTSTFPS